MSDNYCKQLKPEAQEEIRKSRISVNFELFRERFKKFKYNRDYFVHFMKTLKISTPQSRPIIIKNKDGKIDDKALSIAYGLIGNGKLATRSILELTAFDLIKTYGIGYEGTRRREMLLQQGDARMIILTNVKADFGAIYKNHVDVMWSELLDYQSSKGFILIICLEEASEDNGYFLASTPASHKRLMSKFVDIETL